MVQKKYTKVLKIPLLGMVSLGMLFLILVVGVIAGTLTVRNIHAQPAPYLNYQGRLENSNGNLLTGNYYVAFCIYTSTSATACAPASTPATGAITTLNGAVWGEVQYFSSTNSPSNEVENGVFNANLGLYSPLSGSLFNSGSAFYLGVNVYNGSTWDGEMTPRQQIDQVAYAMDSAMLDGYGAATPTGANQIVATSSLGYITLSGTNPEVNATGSNTLTLNGSGATGDVCFFACTTANITSSGNELLSGNIDITGTSTNTISGNTTFNNNITVSGLTTTTGIQNNGNLTNTGTGSFGGNVAISGGTLNLNNTNSNTIESTTNLTFNPTNTNTGNLNIQSTTSLPTAVRDTQLIIYNGYVYEIGSAGATNYYAPALSSGGIGTWTITTSFPSGVPSSGTLIEYNGYVYYIGGCCSVSTVYYAPINSNGTLGSWTATTPLPATMGLSTSVVYNGYVYEIGGWNGSAVVSTVDYASINSNGTLGSWTATTSLPTALGYNTSVTYNGYVYEMGGYNGSTYITTVYYAPILPSGALGAWTTTASLSFTTDAGSAIYDGYVYYSGGGAVCFSQILPSGGLGTWTTTTSLSTPVVAAARLAEYNGYIYVAGGYNGSGTNMTTVDYFSVISGSLNITNSINNNTLISLNGFTGDITTAGNLTVGSGSPGGVNTINGNTILTSADLNVSGLPTPTGLASGSTSNTGGLLPSGTYYYEVIAQNITPLSTSTSFPSQSISVTVNTTISPPTGVTATVGTTGSVGSNLVASTTYYYEVTATTPNGETTKSLEVSAAEGTTAYPITISWSADSGATGYNIYKGTVSGGEQFLASVSGGSTTSYVDSGNVSTVTWPTTTSLPQALYDATSVVYNGYVYEIGGYTTAAVATVYYAPINSDGTIGSWVATTSLPAATEVATSVVYNGYVYEIGGVVAGAYVSTVDYAPINTNGTLGVWTATTSLPVVLDQATSVVYNGYIYEMGGCGNTCPVATVDYALINSNGTIGAWTATTSLPVATYDATSVEYNGYVYEIGGYTTTATAVVDYALINSNGTIGTWTATTSLPVVNNGPATSIIYNGYVYEIGGYDGTANVATVDYVPLESNGTLGTWQATTSLPQATYSATSIVANGYVYEIGGYTTVAVATVYYLNLSSPSVPPLTNTATTNTNQVPLSWSAVLGASSYNIYRSTSPNFTNTTLYVSNTNSFTDTNIQQTTPLPTATDNATSVEYNGYVYEIGGYTTAATATVDYAPINANGTIGTWTSTTSLPVTTDQATSVVYNGYLYEIGGYNGSAVVSAVDYTLINTNGTLGTWKTTTSLPTAIYTATSVVYNGYVYEIGGSNGGTSTATVNYAPINSNGTLGAWTATTSLPIATSSSASIVYNGYVYEIGGNTTTVDYAPINSNGTLGSWTATTSLTSSLALATAVIYKGYIYEIGGYNGSYITTIDYAPINSNGTLGTWTATTSLPQELGLATSVVYNGYVYEIGGEVYGTVLSPVYYFKAQLEGGLLQQSKGSIQTNAQISQNNNGNLNLTGGVHIGGGVSVLGQSNFGSSINLTNPNNDIIASSAPLDIQSSGFSLNLGRNNYIPQSPANPNISSWPTTTPLPTGTYIATSVVYNGYVYEIGGYNGSADVSTVDYAPINSNGTLGSWTATTSLPTATQQATSVIYNGYVYEIGGYTTGVVNTVDYAPINSNGTLGSWTATASLPAFTESATSVVYNGYVYEIGGCGSPCPTTTVDYAPIQSNGTLGSWTATTSLPVATDVATSVVYKGYVYEIGGSTSSAVVTTVDYAPINSNGTLGSWTATTSLPTGTESATSVVYNGYVYEMGGYVVATVDYAPINSNGTLGSWTATTSLPTATTYATSVVYNGYIYEIGSGNSGTQATVYYSSRLTQSASPGYFTIASNASGNFSDIFSLDPYGNAIFAGSLTTGGTPADVAEEVIGSSASPEDIVSASSINPASSNINNFTAIPTTHPYSNNMIGVISTNPSIILHQQNLPNALPLALAGRVLVKVTNYNGNIKVGAMITGSQFAGYGELATTGGRVVGMALNSLNSSTPGVSTFIYNGTNYLRGEILMLVKNEYYNPIVSQVSGLSYQDIQDIGGNINISGNLNLSGNLAVGGHIISTGSLPTLVINSNAGIGAQASLNTGSTDTTGVLNLTTGTSSLKAGTQITVNFKTPYTSTPKVLITPTNPFKQISMDMQGVYVTESKTGFTINFANHNTTSEAYSWNYFVIQ